MLTLALISVAIGLVLAFAYHMLSLRLQTWVAHRQAAMLPVVTILSFVVRLAVLALIMVALALWTPLNVLALCISFLVVFTVLTVISVYRMMAKRQGPPPSADAGSVR